MDNRLIMNIHFFRPRECDGIKTAICDNPKTPSYGTESYIKFINHARDYIITGGVCYNGNVKYEICRECLERV